MRCGSTVLLIAAIAGPGGLRRGTQNGSITLVSDKERPIDLDQCATGSGTISNHS